MSVVLHAGDCLETMARLPSNSIDSVVTDPPYHLTSIVKRFGAEGAAPAKIGQTGAYERASRGFMGKQWDGGDIAFRPELWAEVLRVLKPGGHMVAFSGTRTYHRMACAIEDAGFDIRDQLAWVYGNGFPKSLDISKAIDKAAGATRKVVGFDPVAAARTPKLGYVSVWGLSRSNRRGYRTVDRRRPPVGRMGHCAQAGLGADLPRAQAADRHERRERADVGHGCAEHRRVSCAGG